jgi:type IV pilus assembly protein PilY1
MKPTRHLAGLGLLLLVLFALPFRSDGGQAECCNVTTSLASTTNVPVSGDESFFKLPVGPANVMFLLDTSGSMYNLVQCADAGSAWGDTGNGPRCSWPTSAELSAPATASNVATGTCTVGGNLAWMNLTDSGGTAITKATAPTLVDPGHPTNALGLVDSPSWGTGCTGDACLFNKDGIYGYGSWTETTATAQASCNLYSGGAVVTDRSGNVVGPNAAACQACLDSKGYYFVDYNYQRTATRTSSGQYVLFAGWWLNANPPKFMTARKVIKDAVRIDPASPQPNLDQARFGLAFLTPDGSDRRIVVPLGPSMANSFPTVTTAVVQVRQAILDALNHRNWPTGGLQDLANGSTPLAAALAEVGQYFSSPGVYTGAFGATYERSQFAQTNGGLMSSPWVNSSSCTICWGCQTSATLVITDGSPNTEGDRNGVDAIPAALKTYDEATYAANCGSKASGYPQCQSPSMGSATVLPRVAAWLYNQDLRQDLAVSNPQRVETSTIGFGIKANFGSTSRQWRILEATAGMGGGKPYDAASPADLSAAIQSAVSDVVDRANSFSAPAASSLSTIHTAATEVFVTRFTPNSTAAWQGHLFQFGMVDEFLNGCDPSKTPGSQADVACGSRMVDPNFNGSADATGHNTCSDVFLVDSACDEISEDARTGSFVKKGSGGTAATPFWDAGQVLSTPTATGYRTAATGRPNSRVIWTVVDGARVDFTPANAATLAPRLNLTPTWCANLLPLTKLCGGTSGVACPTVAGWTAANTTTCATAVINYVRGYDVLDADGDNCGGPGVNAGCTPSAGVTPDGEERDLVNDSRIANQTFWKLGDIFHSAPVLVKPPVTEKVCDTGYDNQCVATIRSPAKLSRFAPQTPFDTYSNTCKRTVDAYEQYRWEQRRRQRLVLVGANDGMLHAFDAGIPNGVDAPAQDDCVAPYSTGSGAELWAFIPADLLPRLKDTLLGHQYMVDGSTMVRDVWVDGTGGSARDGTKQKSEFHTVAIVSERGGGTQFTALDVTDPASPLYLWTFPPPCSDDQKYMAESWSDFAPRPPPVGPVKLALAAGDPDPLGRGFKEQWVVMINGGYDPNLSKGAAVWMVDVWTGQTYWRFTNDDFKSQLTFGVGTSMFPVPAAVALTDMGDPTQPIFDSDGFFDTAAWADMGGNLFVARFHAPGVIDAVTGRVGNWFAARTFEQRRRGDDLQYASGRSEFFYMPEWAWEPLQQAAHLYLGSGNRERMMQMGQACGPDNLLSCCKSGCTAVTASTTDAFGACANTTGFTCTNGQLNNAPLTSTCGSGAPACAAAPGNAFTSSVSLSLTCPGTTPATITYSPRATCHADGTCDPVTTMAPPNSITPEVGGTYNGTCTKGRFYGVLAYGGGYPEKMFATRAEAKTFDQSRYTDTPSFVTGCTSAPGHSCSLIDTTRASNVIGGKVPTCSGGVTKCSATRAEPGWFYEYGDVCPAGNCPSFGTCSAERTGSGAVVASGCTNWNGFQPLGAQGGSDPCTGSVGTPLAYGYSSDFVAGVPLGNCGYVEAGSTQLYRGQQRSSVAPPSAPLLRVTAGAGGGVRYGTLQIDPGSPPNATTTSERSEFAESVYRLEISREAHSCRHDPNNLGSSCQ